MKEKLLTVTSIAVSLLLMGCQSTPDNEDNLTMREVHEMHKRNVFGGNVDEARSSWSQISDRNDERVTYNSDLRLPNPELEMYVFPKRGSDGSVSSGYKSKFAMYEKVHYKLGY